MQIPSSDMARETRRRRRGVGTESPAANDLLETLLDGSIRLRDLYRHARRRTTDSQLAQLQRMFDAHYKDQVRLVDVLIDQARIAGGAGRVLAGTFLQDSQLSWDPRSRHARIRMLRTLLDAHELILCVALSGGDEKKSDAWIRDPAVDQVVLANERQSRSICDLLGNRHEDFSMPIPFQLTSDPR
jgi:hypothetical protein